MTSLREEAARWFVRLRQAEPDHPDRGRFEAWLMADPAHAREYAAFEAVWTDFDSTGRLGVLAQAQALRREDRRAARRRLVKQGSLGLLLLGVGAGAGQRWWAAWRDHVLYDVASATGTGERRTLALPDGSHVVLNAQSRLSVVYTRGARRVTLARGEAIFDVRPDPARPFVVEGGLADVTVLGTRFAVLRMDDPAAPEMRVSVAHGRVRVASRAGTGDWLLAAGEALDVTPGGGARLRRDPAVAFDWERGVLVFDNAPLAEVAASLSRYRAVPVRVSPPMPDVRVTAVVQVRDSERFLHHLPRIAPVRVESHGDVTLVVGRSVPPGGASPRASSGE